MYRLFFVPFLRFFYRMNTQKTYTVILIGAIIWCFGIIFPVLLHYWYGETFAEQLLMNFYAPVCHQQPAHSFALFGTPFAVCIRCTSVYFAFLFGIIFWKAILRNKTLSENCSYIFSFPRVFTFLLPMLFDVSLRFVGVYGDEFSLYTLRIISGTLFGFPFALALLPVFFTATAELFSPQFFIK